MILVDGSSLLHRVLHTPQSDLRDRQGRPVGGIHGFFNSLNTAVLKYQLRHFVVVAWDLGVPLFRRELYKEYKPSKEPIGDVAGNLKSEQNLVEKTGEEAATDFLSKYVLTRRLLHSQFLPLCGCLTIQVTNCEADDIIAYICHKITNEEIIIYSTDKDLIQLLSSKVQLFDGRDYTIHTVESVINEHGLNEDFWRRHWLTIRVIAGDSSDGIPGFVGWETAKKYADQLVELQHIRNYALYDALMRLEKPAGARVSSYEALKQGQDVFLRNWRLMDLSYPIDNKLSIIDDIRGEIAKSFIYDIDQNTLEESLHEMDLRMAKTFVSNIIESNLRHVIRDYIERLV